MASITARVVLRGSQGRGQRRGPRRPTPKTLAKFWATWMCPKAKKEDKDQVGHDGVLAIGGAAKLGLHSGPPLPVGLKPGIMIQQLTRAAIHRSSARPSSVSTSSSGHVSSNNTRARSSRRAFAAHISTHTHTHTQTRFVSGNKGHIAQRPCTRSLANEPSPRLRLVNWPG